MRVVFAFAIAVSACLTPACATGPAAAALPAAAPIQGAPIEASAALKKRAEDVVKLINGETEPAQIFSPAVLAQVPAERLSAIAGAVRGKYGRALGVGEINAESPNKGQVLITFEQTQLPLGLGVEAAAPNLINALQF